jgi:hypothetical protein
MASPTTNDKNDSNHAQSNNQPPTVTHHRPVMSETLYPGQPVAIVKGVNRGATGIFVKNVALRQCIVRLDGHDDDQRFLRTSVRAAIVVAPPLSPPSSAGLARATPARKKRPGDSETPPRQLMVDEMLAELNQAKNIIASLEDKLRIMALDK